MERCATFSSDLFTSKDKGWFMICLADLRMRVGKEYSPYALLIGMVITSRGRDRVEKE